MQDVHEQLVCTIKSAISNRLMKNILTYFTGLLQTCNHCITDPTPNQVTTTCCTMMMTTMMMMTMMVVVVVGTYMSSGLKWCSMAQNASPFLQDVVMLTMFTPR